MTTTHTYCYRGYEIVPTRQWANWCASINASELIYRSSHDLHCGLWHHIRKALWPKRSKRSTARWHRRVRASWQAHVDLLFGPRGSVALLSAPLASEFMSFVAADEMRRWYGRVLDLWLARTETPSLLVLEQSGVKLRDYGKEGNGPSLLIIPAPIKKPYIWDLTPEASSVPRLCIAR